MGEVGQLVIEIGCEDLPATLQPSLRDAWCYSIKQVLNNVNLSYQSINGWVTPRRLALQINGLAKQCSEQVIELRGPLLNKAFDTKKKATKTGLGFARKCGVSLKALAIIDSPQGKRLHFYQKKPGLETVQLLAGLIEKSIKQMPLIQSMRWGEQTQAFVRPVRWLLALFDKQVIEVTLWGIQAGRVTYGHRFHHPEPIVLRHSNDYRAALKNTRVIVDDASRQKQIFDKMQSLVGDEYQVIIDAPLLQEVTGLVEWPVVLLGHFSPDFLKLPEEVLISVMKYRQRYFPICDKKQVLQASFVLVSNIESRDPQRVISGNQRVMEARLCDAEFFYRRDCKHPLSHHLEQLKNIVFQKKLGTLHDKAVRMEKLAEQLADSLKLDVTVCRDAARLAKADLASEMVKEFPELQGIMGSYYVSHTNEKTKAILKMAIRQHYQPAYADDKLPVSEIACLVSLLDRCDNLIGLFSIGLRPTGDKDPFALRRAAIGVIRILLARQWPLTCHALLDQVCQVWVEQADASEKKHFNAALIDQVWQFLKIRLKQWCQQNRPISIIAAVLACDDSNIVALNARMQALQAFAGTPIFDTVVATNKRIVQILKKNPTSFVHQPWQMEDLVEIAEKQLASHLMQEKPHIEKQIAARNYEKALQHLATFTEPLTNFFDQVMVLSEHPQLRQTRLALLDELHQLFLKIADFSLAMDRAS